MATSNNLGMYLPTREDYISVKRDISDNLAILDAAAGNMDILVNGNTASVNVTSGQFVTVLNSTITGVTDGIYKAVANVAAGVPFVAANLTSPTSGALNELVEQIGTLDGNIKGRVKYSTFKLVGNASKTITVNAYGMGLIATSRDADTNGTLAFVFRGGVGEIISKTGVTYSYSSGTVTISNTTSWEITVAVIDFNAKDSPIIINS